MADSNHLNIRPIARGWEFVNLFYDRAAATFHCRIRECSPSTHRDCWTEITRSGATMQIAFDRASDAAQGK